MFIKFTRTNSRGEIKESVINSDYLISIKEKHLESTKLYNECGDFVQEITPTEKRYVVILKDGIHCDISEETYNELVAQLVK
jgi:hypothetical protein